MKDLKLTNSSISITEQQFNDFVEEFDLTLPKSYKEFMLKQNGGVPNFSAFGDPYGDGFYIALFSRISIVDEDIDELSNDIDSVRETIVMHQIEEENIPKHFYPFGRDQGGSLYCIDMRDSKVYKYYMDYTTEPRLVTSSFEDFINELENASIYDE